MLWDDETWHALTTRNVELARDTGELTALPVALQSRILEHVTVGELDEAAALGEELQAVTVAIGSQLAASGALGLAAWRGRETDASGLIEASIDEAVSRGDGTGLTWSHYSAARASTTASAATQRPSPRPNGHANTRICPHTPGR